MIILARLYYWLLYGSWDIDKVRRRYDWQKKK